MGFDTEAEVDEKIEPMPLWKRLGRALVALIAIAGLLYLFGVRDYFWFHRTPAGIEQPMLVSKTQATEIVVPVRVNVLSGTSGSSRDDADIYRLVENASHIWGQANMTFSITNIRYVNVTAEDSQLFAQNPQVFIEGHGEYDPTVANVYLARTLGGVNGLAYGGTSAVAVADYTASLDFRTLAHEFGHLLGLEHVNDTRRLMSSGGDGNDLTLDEIAAARSAAKMFSVTLNK